jgi:hypothetical protein
LSPDWGFSASIIVLAQQVSMPRDAGVREATPDVVQEKRLLLKP